MCVIPTNSQRHAPECACAVDSLPVPVCVNIRIRRCRLYPLKEPGANAFRAYVPSKRRCFYGLRVHLMVTGAGEPVEFACPTWRSAPRRILVERFGRGFYLLGTQNEGDGLCTP